MTPEAIIFDFDGVIADSELVAADLFSRYLTGIGLACTPRDVQRIYFGLDRKSQLAAITAQWGDRVPADIAEGIVAHVDHALDAPLQPIAGLGAFLERTAGLPRAIASSNASAHIRLQLGHFGLAHHFGAHVYSGREHVTRGKPHPDLYLHAASALRIDPAKALVIEDSPIGVRAAVAAGARVVGLCAGSHCGPDHGDRLRAAGAHHVARDYTDAARLLEPGGVRPLR